MALQIIHKNILDIEEGLICHFCNVEGVMGAGLAKQIKEKYPEAFRLYQQSQRELGSYTLARIGLNLWCCNIVTQDLRGEGTQYPAVLEALESLELESQSTYGLDVYFPEFVGCGLGKGDVNAIHAMIEHFLPRAILVRHYLN